MDEGTPEEETDIHTIALGIHSKLRGILLGESVFHRRRRSRTFLLVRKLHPMRFTNLLRRFHQTKSLDLTCLLKLVLESMIVRMGL